MLNEVEEEKRMNDDNNVNLEKVKWTMVHLSCPSSITTICCTQNVATPQQTRKFNVGGPQSAIHNVNKI